MFRRSRLSAYAVLALCALAVSACGSSTTGGAKNPVAAAAPTGAFDPNTPVTLALLAPSTAENAGAAQLGVALGNAARMAAADLGDPLINLRVYNTGGQPEMARTAVTQALADGARIILGPLFGNNTTAIAGPAAGKGVKVLSFSTDSTIAGAPVWVSGFLPEMAARRITSFARAQGYGAQGIFYPATPYGDLAVKGAQAGAGPALVSRTRYERTEAGIPAAAPQFAADVNGTGARALLVAESGQALKFVMSQLSGQGLGTGRKFLGLGEWNTRSTLQTRGLRGAWFPAPDPAAMSAFVRRYRQSFGEVPPPLAVLAYDAVQVAGQMLIEARATGSGDPFSAQALTRPQGFSGAVGPIRFLADGLTERGLSILSVGEATFQTIDPTPVAFGLGS